MEKARMNETIACSPYTPISVLEKLIEVEQEKIKTANRDYVVRSSNKNISLANINIVCQKTNMSPEIITETLYFFEKSGHTFGTSKVPTKYERNLISAYKSGVGNETFEQIRNAMINSYSDLNEDSKSKASRFEYVVSYIEKEEKIYDCETYETMSLFALEKEKENIFRKVANDGKDGIDTLYENIEKNLNKYNQINQLIAERKSEIEKEGVDIDAR